LYVSIAGQRAPSRNFSAVSDQVAAALGGHYFKDVLRVGPPAGSRTIRYAPSSIQLAELSVKSVARSRFATAFPQQFAVVFETSKGVGGLGIDGWKCVLK
jgi:hypothetical protein